MYAANPPGSWQHFTKRQDNVGLSLMEVRSKYLKEQLMYEEFISHTIQQQRQQAQANQGKGKKVTTVQTGLSSNCIAFVNNTTDGTYSEISITTSGSTNYTVTWGDGTVDTGTVNTSATITHDYADSDQSYNCTLCFDDISLVTELDFLGDD
jgi:hypothetical protein